MRKAWGTIKAAREVTDSHAVKDSCLLLVVKNASESVTVGKAQTPWKCQPVLL